MKQTIVQSDLGVTVIGGGRLTLVQISRATKVAPVIVAADGGAVKAVKLGCRPDHIIGDMDSHPPLASALGGPEIHHIAEQDTTDFEKCLYSVAAPFIIALGVTGDRLDHSLAAMNALAKYPDKTVIVLSGKDLCFLCPCELTLDLPVGTRFSLFPLAPLSAASQGLTWPLDGVALSPLGTIGTSNRTDAKTVTIKAPTRQLLVILPARYLGAALRSLTA